MRASTLACRPSSPKSPQPHRLHPQLQHVSKRTPNPAQPCKQRDGTCHPSTHHPRCPLSNACSVQHATRGFCTTKPCPVQHGTSANHGNDALHHGTFLLAQGTLNAQHTNENSVKALSRPANDAHDGLNIQVPDASNPLI